MEDSNTMTIEFLRARLLSERSVSKSARQRADELARRVCREIFFFSIMSLPLHILFEEPVFSPFQSLLP